MKKIGVLVFVVGILLWTQYLNAQVVSGPYLYMTSEEYKPPRGYDAEGDLMYSHDSIFQANMVYKKGLFNFQQFSQDLKFQKENSIDFQSKFKGDVRFAKTVTLKTKKYVFVRDIDDSKKEIDYGMEFFPDKLSISEPVEICKPAGKLIGKPSLIISNDKSKFLYKYKTLDSLDKKENTLGKETIGLIVFDENLQKICGAEFEMPQPQVKMQILDMILTDDGNVYILTGVGRIDRPLAVFGASNPSLMTDAKFDYLEVLQVKDGKMLPGLQINAEAYKINLIGGKIVESPLHEIVIAGAYAREGKTQRFFEYIKGIFITKIEGGKINPDLNRYDITMNMMRDQASSGELKTLEKFSEEAIGYKGLEVIKVLFMPDGSTKVVLDQKVFHAGYSHTSSQYNPNHMATHSSPYTYTTTSSSPYITAGDAVVFSIGADKNLAWLSKIKKSQTGVGENGYNLTVNALVKGNDLHVFYVDDDKGGELQILKYNPQGTIISTPLSIKHARSLPIRVMLKSNGMSLIGNDKNIHKNNIYTIVIN